MEVLGAVASIAAVAEFGEKLLELCHHLKNAPNELRLVAHRVKFLSINLKLLTLAEDDLKNSTYAQDYVYPALTEAITNAVQVHTLIQQMLPSTVTKPAGGKSLRWALKDKRRYEELTTTLSGLETSLGATLQLVQL
jgi:hypothetical protein